MQRLDKQGHSNLSERDLQFDEWYKCDQVGVLRPLGMDGLIYSAVAHRYLYHCYFHQQVNW